MYRNLAKGLHRLPSSGWRSVTAICSTSGISSRSPSSSSASNLLDLTGPGKTRALYGGAEKVSSVSNPAQQLSRSVAMAQLAAEPFMTGTSSMSIEETYQLWLEDPNSVHKNMKLNLNWYAMDPAVHRLPIRIPPAVIPSPLWSPVLPTVIITIDGPEKDGRPSAPVSCPLNEKRNEIRATNRVKRQRWRHCRKKAKKQRMKKLRFVIMKDQDEKERVRETQFRMEMSTTLKNALSFDPEKYVRDTMARATWKPTPDTLERMRARIFWTEFMTVEQLFGVPDGDYIDKKDGFAGEEDWQQILELREKYNSEYKKKK